MSRFKLLPSKTIAYENSVLPALSRLLVGRNAELGYYLSLLYHFFIFPLLKFLEEAENFAFQVK